MMTTAIVAGVISADRNAYAQTTAQASFSVPAGPLNRALTTFGRQAGLQVTYLTRVGAGKTSPGISGSATREQALARILQGTGLSYRFTNSTTVAISETVANAGAATVEGAIPLDTIDVQGERADLLPSYAGGQVARGGQVGLLGNKDFMQTPFSMANYTAKTISDQQALSVADVLTTSDPSVRAAVGPANRYDSLIIRGLRGNNSEIAVNGLYGILPFFRVGPDAIERIELLKGPSAFLFGMPPGGSVGGTVNVITKRASDTPLTRLTAEYASDSRFGGHLDVGRRFGDNKEFGVRFNGAWRGGDSPVDLQNSRNQAASLGLDYHGERFRISADIIYQHDWYRAPDRGYTIVPGIAVPAAPRNGTNISRPFDYSNSDSITAMTRAEFDLTSNVTAFAAIGGNYNTFDKLEAPGGTFTSTNGTTTSTSRYQEGKYQTWTGELGLRGKFDTGPFRHEVTFSANRLNQGFWLGEQRYANFTTNIYNPVFPPLGAKGAFTPYGKSTDVTLTSFAIADTVSFAGDLIQVTGGVRRQSVESNNYNQATGAVTSHYDDSAITPMVGIVVRPTKMLSLYANYIEGLSPGGVAPSTASNAGQVFAPFKTTQVETGAKLDFGQIATTLSAFQITVPSGLIDPTTNLYGTNGEQRHRGLEWSVFGELYPGVRLLGGLTYIDARLTKATNPADVGNKAVGVPDFAVNLGAEWDTPFIHGLTLSARVIHTASAFMDTANLQKVPDWTRFDFGARYTTKIADKQVVFRASLTNAFNTAYWEANPTSYLTLSSPRTVWLSVSTDF